MVKGRSVDQHLKCAMRKSIKKLDRRKKFQEKAKSQENIMLVRFGKEKMGNNANNCRKSKKNILGLVIACT